MKYLTLVIFILIFTSCSTENPSPTYTLSTSISPLEGGELEISPRATIYKEGDVVTITPKPNQTWKFEKWEGDITGTSNPLQVIMNSNLSITGVFNQKFYPLNITIEGQGVVQEKVVLNTSGREYPEGTTVELLPIPSEGWEFRNWGGDHIGNEIPLKITVDKEKNIITTFRKILTPEDLAIQDLCGVDNSITWQVSGGGSVIRNGISETSLYLNFNIKFTSNQNSKTYTTENGRDLFDNSGNWTFDGTNISKIILNGSSPTSGPIISFTRTGNDLRLAFNIITQNSESYTFNLRKK